MNKMVRIIYKFIILAAIALACGYMAYITLYYVSNRITNRIRSKVYSGK